MAEQIQELIEALQNPKAYLNPITTEIKLIHTAISVVFLAGDFAYKISKPVNFGFLDFTTLPQRKECYDKEVEFNSLISPQLYKGVVAITKNSNGEIKIDSDDGEIIEYAIKMKRCNPNNVMKERLGRGEVTQAHVIELAQIIAAFHKKAPMSDEISSYGKMEAVSLNLMDNFEHTKKAIGLLVSPADFDFMKTKVKNFLESHAELIAHRVSSGHIKHCHGDLHSGNVFIENDEIIVFDGIVFNKRFPNCDTICDLATMITDLEIFDREDLALTLIETYQQEIDDEDLKTLLPLYKCYRAHVRGKIQFFMYSDPSIPDEKKEKIVAEGKKYFAFAKKYAEQL